MSHEQDTDEYYSRYEYYSDWTDSNIEWLKEDFGKEINENNECDFESFCRQSFRDRN